jgi:hypothetical protein
MIASLGQLARRAADGWVRVEVVHSSASGQRTSSLRLSVCDASGWFEYHQLAGNASALARPARVVDIAELLQAVELDPHTGDLLEIEVADDDHHRYRARSGAQCPAPAALGRTPPDRTGATRARG